MTKSDHHKPINLVGLYFVDEERYETGQIIAQISDGYYWPSSIVSRRAPRHPNWKSYPRLSSTNSVTVVARDIGDSLPMLKVKEVDDLVEYARSGKRQDGQGSAPQTQARATGLKLAQTKSEKAS